MQQCCLCSLALECLRHGFGLLAEDYLVGHAMNQQHRWRRLANMVDRGRRFQSRRGTWTVWALQVVGLPWQSEVCACAAEALKYDAPNEPAPVTESQILMPRRVDDRRPDLWGVFNRTQENLIQGGLRGRSANGRRQQARPVQSID